MLARPEPGTREHIMLWLAGKPARGWFQWDDVSQCACAQYFEEAGFGSRYQAWWRWDKSPAISEMNKVAGSLAHANRDGSDRVTWDRLRKALAAHWQNGPRQVSKYRLRDA